MAAVRYGKQASEATASAEPGFNNSATWPSLEVLEVKHATAHIGVADPPWLQRKAFADGQQAALPLTMHAEEIANSLMNTFEVGKKTGRSKRKPRRATSEMQTT